MHVSFDSKITVRVIDIVTHFKISSQRPDIGRLAKIVQSNTDHFDRDHIAKILQLPKPNIQRLHKLGFDQWNLWDESGQLTDDGRIAAETSIVHQPQSGGVRLWVFEHPITGIVPVHVDTNRSLPSESSGNQKGNKRAPEVQQLLKQLCNMGRFPMLLDNKDGSQTWFEFSSKQLSDNWETKNSFETVLNLSWIWTHSPSGFEVEPELNITGNISGKSGNPFEIGNCAISDKNTIEPNQKFRQWLSAGDFASSPWDIEHSGMRRPYSELTIDEKLRQTIESLSLSGDDVDEWDSIEIRDMPLLAANENDASEWARFLLEKRNPGYWTTERSERLLEDIVGEEPFCTVASDRIIASVNKDLEEIRIGSRTSKLFNAGDDLSSAFLIPEHILKQKKDANRAEYVATEGHSKFLNTLSHDIKGDTHEVWYVDRYTVDRRARRELAKFCSALQEHFPSAAINVLTSHSQYRPSEIDDVDASVSQFRGKFANICNRVRFMEEGDFAPPHHRYIIIRTNKETRWWIMDDGMLSALNRPKHASLWDESSVETELVQHIQAYDNENKEAPK